MDYFSTVETFFFHSTKVFIKIQKNNWYISDLEI
jgi:hypothetical protein